MERTVEGFGDAEGAILRALQARRDGGAPFIGDEVVAFTPLGQKIVRVVESDENGLRLERPRTAPQGGPP